MTDCAGWCIINKILRRTLHVKGCNGENCKINIAGMISGLDRESARLLATHVVGVFAIQLLNIVVNLS